MTATRLQHIVPAAVIFTLSMIVTWLSFTQEPEESYLFPRIISIFFIGLAAWNLIRAGSGLARVGSGISVVMLRNFLPGLIVILIYTFFAAKALGFYASSTLAFIFIYSLYDPAPISDISAWRKRIIVITAFIAVIYGLFAIVLQVHTPRGILI